MNTIPMSFVEEIVVVPVDTELEAFIQATNAKFDAPCGMSFFAHLMPEPDGSLQRTIDEGARLHELEDARQDEEFNRRGGWL